MTTHTYLLSNFTSTSSHADIYSLEVRCTPTMGGDPMTQQYSNSVHIPSVEHPFISCNDHEHVRTCNTPYNAVFRSDNRLCLVCYVHLIRHAMMSALQPWQKIHKHSMCTSCVCGLQSFIIGSAMSADDSFTNKRLPSKFMPTARRVFQRFQLDDLPCSGQRVGNRRN